LASSTTKDSLITQEALKTWNYIYRQKAFKSNVQRGVHWQTILQNYLLKHAFNEKQEEENCLQKEKEENRKMGEHQKKTNHTEQQKKVEQIKQQKIDFIQQTIKIKLEPNTTLTEITTNDDEDSIEMITID